MTKCPMVDEVSLCGVCAVSSSLWWSKFGPSRHIGELDTEKGSTYWPLWQIPSPESRKGWMSIALLSVHWNYVVVLNGSQLLLCDNMRVY